MAENDQVRASFDRCEGTGEFAERFYEIFLAASPELAPLFANTNFGKQRKLLRATVYILVTRSVDDPEAREALVRIGQSHSRKELNIKPELYEIWLDSVCQTVKSMDPEWTSECETPWRDRLRPGIDLITSLY